MLRFVVQGLANKEIATEWNCRKVPLRMRCSSSSAKTNVRTRSQLVRVALEQYRDLL